MNIDPQTLLQNASMAEDFLRQLANKNRLMILCALLDGELSVGEINVQIPLSQSALSQHLAALRKGGLVATRRESQTIYYCLNDARVKPILQTLYSLFCAV